MTQTTKTLTLAAALLLAASCGDDARDASDLDPSSLEARLMDGFDPESFAEAWIAQSARCCGTPVPGAQFAGRTEADCESNAADDAHHQRGLVDLYQFLSEQPHVTFDSAAYDACVDALLTAECEQPLGTACDAVFVGSLTDGDSCVARDECPQGYQCERPLDSACGVCVAQAALGEACNHPDAGSCDYRADLRCVDGVCVQFVDKAAGDACDGYWSCGNLSSSGLVCAESVDGTKTCQQFDYLPPGTRCEVSDATRDCAGQDYGCGDSDGDGVTACELLPVPGEPCWDTDNIFETCNPDVGRCEPETGLCKAHLSPGASCPPGFEGQISCGILEFCIDRSCVHFYDLVSYGIATCGP